MFVLALQLNTIYHHDTIGKKKITISVVQIKLVKDGVSQFFSKIPMLLLLETQIPHYVVPLFQS